jgi:hypothetical protein
VVGLWHRPPRRRIRYDVIFYSRIYCLIAHDKNFILFLLLLYSRQSITEASLLELERNWSNHDDVEPNNENAAGANDTVQLQLFYGQE